MGYQDCANGTQTRERSPLTSIRLQSPTYIKQLYTLIYFAKPPSCCQKRLRTTWDR